MRAGDTEARRSNGGHTPSPAGSASVHPSQKSSVALVTLVLVLSKQLWGQASPCKARLELALTPPWGSDQDICGQTMGPGHTHPPTPIFPLPTTPSTWTEVQVPVWPLTSRVVSGWSQSLTEAAAGSAHALSKALPCAQL